MTRSPSRSWLPVLAVCATFILLAAAIGRQTVAADPRGGPPAGPERGSMGITTGPDVTIIDLPNVQNWGASGGIRAYSVATDSCNVGSEPVNWCDDPPAQCTNGAITLLDDQHPVIAQNLYRYDADNGRFEQIGMSWLKHGFLSLNDFHPECVGNDGSGNPTACLSPPLGSDQLGVGCTDLYSAGLNGSQPLGPRSEVDATTGTYPFPHGGTGSGTIAQRIQVAQADLQLANARFFVEGQYVVDNDAMAGNGFNNASYREVFVDPGDFDLDTAGMLPTVRELPAIFAWQAIDPQVEIVAVDFGSPIVERFHAARRVTDLGGGQWHYEYAIHNLSSDRSARSFTVDFGNSTALSSVGFRDVDHHSGEPYETADWSAAVDPGAGTVAWSTDTFVADPNANALRWGTMFSFWFDADRGPAGVGHTLGLFKPGSPTQVTVPFDAGTVGELIFTDGFESGDLSAWSATVP